MGMARADGPPVQRSDRYQPGAQEREAVQYAVGVGRLLLKVMEEAFPCRPIQEAGYRAAVFGQKTYDGVEVLARDERKGQKPSDHAPVIATYEAQIGARV